MAYNKREKTTKYLGGGLLGVFFGGGGSQDHSLLTGKSKVRTLKDHCCSKYVRDRRTQMSLSVLAQMNFVIKY